jgi:hypothetical protein
MSEKTDERQHQACAECRWVGLWPQTYGAVEYFCERRQVVMPSAGIDRRRCAEFER